VNPYSITSNTVKLLKHLPKLANIQRGVVAPIMVHVVPTHRCQLNCVHCCFKNREDRTKDFPLGQFKEAMGKFRRLGTRAIEFTGGGEPTLWSPINLAIEYLYMMGFKMGIITNGLNVGSIKRWDWFEWIRISLNTLEYKELDLKGFPKWKISFCYIWHSRSHKHIEKVVDFANKNKIICRIAPDCIKSPRAIETSMAGIRQALKKFPKNKYVFLSDFNVITKRRNLDCRIHMIKPALYLDGWVYACPSSELAVENGRRMHPKFRVCQYYEIEDFYHSEKSILPRIGNCSYCKYSAQQDLLEDLLTETEFNEFA